MYVIMYDYAVEMRDKVKPDFTVQPAWREELFRRYQSKGIEVDRALFNGAARAIDRELELRIARIAFGDSTARRHSLDDDPQLQKALELLRRGSSQQDLFALVTAKR
jgi:carboxyl-terminal processing protease